MYIATFVGSLVVLRTLLTVQPQSAWRLTELQTAMEGWFCNGGGTYKKHISESLEHLSFVQSEPICINIARYTFID